MALKDLGPGAKTLAFSNDGRTLLTGGLDGIVRLWTLPEPLLARRD
jgi:WD40 repeat protein